jgi:hypothetical protein
VDPSGIPSANSLLIRPSAPASRSPTAVGNRLGARCLARTAQQVSA